MDPPRQPAGRQLIGWVARRNSDAISDELYASKADALAAAQITCPYPLQWTVGATDAQGHDHLWGVHPERLALDKMGWRETLGPDGDRRLRDLAARVGDEATHDRWYVEPIYRARTRRIPRASYPHDGARYFAAPCRDDQRRWSVFYDRGPDEFSRPLETLDTEEEALVRAGELDYRDQRRFIEVRNRQPRKRILRGIAWLIAKIEGLFSRGRE